MLSSGQQVAVLHLVQHQKAVVLANHVVVGPDAHQQGEQSLLAGKHHERAEGKEKEQAAVQQVAVADARLGIEVGAAGGGENVSAVEAHAPEPPKQRDLDVQSSVEQQVDVTGENAADNEAEIHSSIHDPAWRRARWGCGDSGH